MFDVTSDEYRRAAISLNYELEAVFIKNLEFFKAEDPALYRTFKNYRAKTLQLRLSPEGYLNLYNLNTNAPVYPKDPIEYAKEQVEYHLERRPAFSLSLVLPDNGRDDYPYTKCLVKLEQSYLKHLKGVSLKGTKESLQMFMFGGGLFLQLQYILNAIDVKSLSIFEADHDSFFASMHVIYWSEIYKYFDRDGYNFNFNIVSKDQKDIVKLAAIYFGKGFHHFPYIEEYMHYENDEIRNLGINFKNHLQTIIGSPGFFEDEKIGLAHTIANLDKNLPLCTSKDLNDEAAAKMPPVIIVGNGPSLDDNEDFLRQNQQNFIVISCGSAFSALLKKGIRPDFHVEQERMSATSDWLEESTTAEQRKGIPLLALNVCHPRTFDLFDQGYMLLKPNDLGYFFIDNLGIEGLTANDYSLPLVGNTGLSVAVGLGFSKIYLLGIDCGMASEDTHHSKDSNYFNEKAVEDYDNTVKERNERYGTFKVKGNFVDQVTTMSVYNTSRIELQGFLEKTKPECYNLSNGAYIEGAEPLRKENVAPQVAIENKKDFVEKLLESNFTHIESKKDELKVAVSYLKKGFSQNIDALQGLFILEGLSTEEMIKRFDLMEVILQAMKLTDIENHILINGSLRGLAYKLTMTRHNLTDEQYANFYNEAKVYIDNFFAEVRHSMKEGFLDYDD